MSTAVSRAPLPLPRDQREPWGTFLPAMFRIGINSFGGPVAQIGLMHQEAVERRKWLTDAEFVHLLNFANVLPGPEALEIAIHLGYLRRGILGGIVAGLLFIWPGFVSLTALGWIYLTYGKLQGVTGFLDGMRPAAMALIAAAAIRLSSKALKGPTAYTLMAIAFLASYLIGIPFILILLGSGLLGLLFSSQKRTPETKSLHLWVFLVLSGILFSGIGWTAIDSKTSSGGSLSGPVDVPSPMSAAEGDAPFSSPEVTLERLKEVAWLNTKAALITFGGAYTVLPYLREQAVVRYRWVSDTQMIDALALGETTPGPLISIGVFISYLAAGFAGAMVGCFFLFLPSFVFVLTLAPHIHKVETLPGAPAFLWGVSAGTVGLILSLSAQLAPESIDSLFAAAVAIMAFVAVWRLKWNIILVVMTAGMIGWARAALW